MVMRSSSLTIHIGLHLRTLWTLGMGNDSKSTRAGIFFDIRSCALIYIHKRLKELALVNFDVRDVLVESSCVCLVIPLKVSFHLQVALL